LPRVVLEEVIQDTSAEHAVDKLGRSPSVSEVTTHELDFRTCLAGTLLGDRHQIGGSVHRGDYESTQSQFAGVGAGSATGVN
jgi:hypothetical protein